MRRCPFQAPASNWVDSGIDVALYRLGDEHPEKIPEQVKGRGTQDAVLTGLQSCDLERHLSRTGRRSERRRHARREFGPGGERITRMVQPKIESLSEVQHRELAVMPVTE